MSDFFEIDPTTAQTIGDPLAIGGTIRLPFVTLDLWWKNGSGNGSDPVSKFGGWAVNAESYDAWMTEFNEVPAGMSGPHEWTSGTDMSVTYSAYCARSLWVAPIARRSAWFLKQGGAKENNRDWKSSVNYLCYAANYDKDGDKMTPLGPVVLSAKSNNGLALDEAFQTYRNQTAKGRKEFAKNLPAHFFYQCIGTFGQKIETKKVGPQGNQKDITYAKVFMPSEVNEKNLRLTFVGGTISAIMADLKNQSAEWVNDWNSRNSKKSQEASAEVSAPQPPEFDEMPF